MEPPAMNLQIIFSSIFGKSRRAMPRNPSVERGSWGEDLAARHLSSLGWRILERNARPFSHDRRCELDIVAFIASENKVVFVEVKTHKRRNGKAPRMWGIDKNKKRNLLRAGTGWIMRHRWHGNWRFDVLEIYGETGSPEVEIDHIADVRIFPPRWRFW
jgi:putative endonuclease